MSSKKTAWQTRIKTPRCPLLIQNSQLEFYRRKPLFISLRNLAFQSYRPFSRKTPADVEALCDSIVGVSRLAVTLGDQLVGLDINPLIVLPKGQGVIAVDAV